MAAKIDKGKCTVCGRCVDVCPVDAIKLKDNIVVVNENECIDCGACINYCPNDAISL